MRRWTLQQDELLKSFSNQGADEIRRQLHKEFGVIRSVSAIQSRASRIGVSLVRYEVCPNCGQPMPKAEAWYGVCKVCRRKAAIQNAKDYQGKLLKELRRLESDESKEQLQRYEREYATLRQQNARLARDIKSRKGGNGENA